MPRASLHAFAFIVTLAWPVPLPADPAVLKPKPGPLPFEYEPAPEPLPNYVSGARWGTQSDPIRTMQKPLPPAVSATRLLLPDHFESHLFASEPEILKPICMAWDERGRLWIAETVDYPNELRSAGEGRDRIRICEDADGDGRADRFTLFADKLSIPTSMVTVQGGVIVAEAPDMLLLRDTDGDDRADERKVLFTGWGTFDTHAGPSNLRWGFDNWIWGVVGYSGFDGTVGGRSIKFGMGFFRFKPDGSQLEFVRSSNNNTWGLGFAEDGTLFGSTANGNPSMYMPIPNRMYEQVSGWSASRLESIATNMHIYPSTPKVRQVDWHDRYTAGAGHALYTARSFPREYWNRRAFVCEPTGHLIGMFDLVADGADFVAQNLGSFLASDDEWTSPIAAEVGPDGALWLIDWYNYIIQHNPVPHGFKNGKGNAYETGLRDKRHGRIYRITHKAGKPTPQPRLHGGSPNDWVKALSNENMLWRMHAQRLIVERKAKETVPELIKLVKNRSVDELGFNLGALHALRTLQGLEAPELGSVAGEALTHPSSGVKRAALDALPRNARSVQAILEKEALHDPNDQVRLAALLALAEMPPDVSAGVMTHLVAGNVRTHRSRWLREAAACAGAKHTDGFLQALVAKRPSSIPAGVVEIVGVVVRHRCLTAGTGELLDLATSMNGASRSVASAVLDSLAQHWPDSKKPDLSAETARRFNSLMSGLNPDSRPLLIALVRRWGNTTWFGKETQEATVNLRKTYSDPEMPELVRIRAARTWIKLSENAETASQLLSLLSPETPPAIGSGVIQSLSESRSPEVGAWIAAHWKHYSPSVRRSALSALLRKTEWSSALLDAIESQRIAATDLAAEHWQQLGRSSDTRLATRAAELRSKGGTFSADREEVVKKLLHVAEIKGDLAKGEAAFRSACAVCHSLKGQGGKVGPDLTGAGARDRKDLLIEILDPNRSVEANYRMWTATTKDGETFSGRLDSETTASVEILDVAGQRHVIQRSSLKSLEGSPLSVMPVGFEALSEADLAGILEFLK